MTPTFYFAIVNALAWSILGTNAGVHTGLIILGSIATQIPAEVAYYFYNKEKVQPEGEPDEAK